jgi:hypothetical protein
MCFKSNKNGNACTQPTTRCYKIDSPQANNQSKGYVPSAPLWLGERGMENNLNIPGSLPSPGQPLEPLDTSVKGIYIWELLMVNKVLSCDQ